MAHAVPLGNLGHHVPVRLSQAPDDLLIAVSRLLHLPLVFQEAIVSSYRGSKKPGQVSYICGRSKGQAALFQLQIETVIIQLLPLDRGHHGTEGKWDGAT